MSVKNATDTKPEAVNPNEFLMIPKVTVYPVFAQNVYRCQLDKVELAKRVPFGSQDGMPTDDCFNFKFLHITENADGTISYPKVASIIDGVKPLNPAFTTQCGTSYGSKKATLTKIVTWLAGVTPSKDEIARLPLTKFQGMIYDLLITVEVKDDGTKFNKIVGITPINSVPLASLLLNEDPFVSE